MTRRVENAPGYVLHARAWRETSLIVEAFTPEFGRVGLVARGARSARSQLRGLLLPFRGLLLSWSGRGELPTLTGADPGSRVQPLTGRVLFSGFYVNELVMKLLPRNDPCPELFEHYRQAVDGLGSGGAPDIVLRMFEKRLLDALGYGPTLDRAADTGSPVSAGKRYRYIPEHGPMEEAGPAAGLEVSGRTLLALTAGAMAPLRERERTEARRLMRSILDSYLGPHPLGSRKLFWRPAPSQSGT